VRAHLRVLDEWMPELAGAYRALARRAAGRAAAAGLIDRTAADAVLAELGDEGTT